MALKSRRHVWNGKYLFPNETIVWMLLFDSFSVSILLFTILEKKLIINYEVIEGEEEGSNRRRLWLQCVFSSGIIRNYRHASSRFHISRNESNSLTTKEQNVWRILPNHGIFLNYRFFSLKNTLESENIAMVWSTFLMNFWHFSCSCCEVQTDKLNCRFFQWIWSTSEERTLKRKCHWLWLWLWFGNIFSSGKASFKWFSSHRENCTNSFCLENIIKPVNCRMGISMQRPKDVQGSMYQSNAMDHVPKNLPKAMTKNPEIFHSSHKFSSPNFFSCMLELFHLFSGRRRCAPIPLIKFTTRFFLHAFALSLAHSLFLSPHLLYVRTAFINITLLAGCVCQFICALWIVQT